MFLLSQTTTRQKVFFGMSLMIAVGYGLAYHRHQIGVSPFHLSARLPGLDMLVLLVTVILPLAVGIALGVMAGGLKWFVLPVYAIAIGVSLY